MFERVGAQSGVERDPVGGRTDGILSSLQSSMVAGVITALATIQAAAQEKEQPRPLSHATELQTLHTPDTTLRAWMSNMNAGTFDRRQAAWSDAKDVLWRGFDTDDEDPDALLKRLRAMGTENGASMSAEQKQRVRSLDEALSSWRTNYPQALPPVGGIRGGNALLLLRKRIPVPLHVDDEHMPMLDATELSLPASREARLVTKTLAKLCAASKTIPRRLPDESVSLVAANENERVVATDELLCVVRESDDGKTRTVELQFEPGRGVLIALFNEHGAYHPSDLDCAPDEAGKPVERAPTAIDESTTLTIASAGRPELKGISAMGHVNTTISRPIAEGFDALVADTPRQAVVKPEGKSVRLGFQTFSATTPEQRADGTWSLLFKNTVCSDVPWPPTPVHWDRTTYEAANATRYIVRDEEGKEMPVTIESTIFNERCVDVTVVCPRKPAESTIVAMTEIRQKSFWMPDIGPLDR